MSGIHGPELRTGPTKNQNTDQFQFTMKATLGTKAFPQSLRPCRRRGAGLSAPAMAQTSVTLYGVVDAPVEYVSKMASSPPTLINGQATYQPGGSRFAMGSIGGLAGPRRGLRGAEDLGGAKHAIFVLESGFGVDNGVSANGGRLFGRQAFVGLQADAGKIMLGRQYTPLFETLANFAPLRYASLYEPVVELRHRRPGFAAKAVNLTQPAAVAVAPVLQRSLASMALKIRQNAQGAYPCGAGGGK
jgi:hypothetical protein